MIVAEREWAEQHKLEPMARLAAYGIGAVEPGMFGLGPIPAVRQALERAGWKTGDIERIEITISRAARFSMSARNGACVGFPLLSTPAQS